MRYKELRWAGMAALLGIGFYCSGDSIVGSDAGGGGSSDVPADVPSGTDVQGTPLEDVPTSCPMAPQPFMAGSAEGNPTPLTVPAGGVRAGRLEASELPMDRTGLGVWTAGDYVVANERVALIIEQAHASSGYDPWGGKPVGVARVESGRMVDAGDFNENFFGLGRFTLATERVTVLRDGSDGTAVVRAEGPMRPIPFIDEFGRAIAPADYSDIRAVYDYELRPGADHVDVRATYVNNGPSPEQVRTVIHAFFQGYRMQRFVPDRGFVGASGASTPTMGWVDEEGMGWAWQIPTGNLTSLISVSGFDGFSAPQITLNPCAQTQVHVARLVIGGRGLDGLQSALARTAMRRQREVRATVNDADGRPVAGARVHATSADGTRYLTRATTDSMGVATLHVPDGEGVNLAPWRAGEVLGTAVAVPAQMNQATLRLGPMGSIRVVARDAADMTGLPVRVQVFPATGDPPAVPGNMGERAAGQGRLHVAYPQDGNVTLPAAPGRWRVVVSRGYEYDISDTTVTVAAGMTADVNANLRRVVTTPGVLCGDFHIHTTRSPDSEDHARVKLLSGAGDGVEVMARSDHEWVNDFQPTIDAMGLQQWVRGLASLEFTTFTWGHFGVFPLTPSTTRPNGGTFDWVNRLPPAVFADVRARPERPTLVINHPRGSASGSYFSAAQYDPVTGTGTASHWDNNFTAVEFFNDSSFEENMTPERNQVRDWFSFLNRGRRVYAVGSSDSHGIEGSPVGYPRTCMFLGTDDPRMATPQAIGTAVGAGRSYISGGIYLSAGVTRGPAAVGPGEEATGVGAEARVLVTAQAAPWVRADRIEVYSDSDISGVNTVRPRQTIMLTEAMRDPQNPVIRYRGEVTVPVAAGGSWVVIVAQGGELTPVHRGRRAFGVTNPIFLRR